MLRIIFIFTAGYWAGKLVSKYGSWSAAIYVAVTLVLDAFARAKNMVTAAWPRPR